MASHYAKIVGMTPSGVHRNPVRNFRPTPAEYDPAKAAVDAAGWDIGTLLRAMLRWFNRDPHAVLALLADDLAAVRDDTPRGRPPKTDQ